MGEQLSQKQAANAISGYFDVVQEPLSASLKTLCQERVSVGPYQISTAGSEALSGAASAGLAVLCVPIRDSGDGKLRLFVPLADALAATGLSMYESTEEIEAKRSTGIATEDDLDGLKSLADQLFAAVATGIREALGVPFACEQATVECRAFNAEELAALLPTELAVARFPLTVDPYEESFLLFTVPEAVAAELAKPAEADAPQTPPAAPQSAPVSQPAAAAEPVAAMSNDAALRRILNIAVPVIVVLAETKVTTDEVLQITEGTVIQFNKGDEEWLDLLVNNKRIGRGIVIKAGKKLGLKIEEVGDAKEIIKKL